jgi:type IV pilus assembly protein PilC
MSRWAYVAVDPKGDTISGTWKANSREAAEIALYEKELREIRVVEKPSLLKREISPPRVKRIEVMHLSRQLAAFIRAGLPILTAIHTLGEDAKKSTVKKMMADVEDRLRRGETLSDCFDRYPKIFPEYYRGILRSAELTGQLDTVLDQLSGYLEREAAAKQKIKSASIYPAAVAAMSVVTVVVLAVFVLPRFRDFFASFDATLPVPTRILMGFTDFLANWWWALLGGFAVLVLAFIAALQTDGGRYQWNKFTLKVPVIGEAIQYALVERFCRLMSSMIGAGVSLPESLRVATASLKNKVYTRALHTVREQMMQGEGIAKPIAATGLFPSMAQQMLRVGEETGSLDTQLDVAARFYERELDYKIKKVTDLFEPIVIVVMGSIVGFVAVALISAMYGIYSQVHA